MQVQLRLCLRLRLSPQADGFAGIVELMDPVAGGCMENGQVRSPQRQGAFGYKARLAATTSASVPRIAADAAVRRLHGHRRVYGAKLCRSYFGF